MREKLPDGNSEVVAVGGAHWRPASTGAPDSPSDVGDALKSVLSGDATPGVSCGLLSTSERELVNSPIIQTGKLFLEASRFVHSSHSSKRHKLFVIGAAMFQFVNVLMNSSE